MNHLQPCRLEHDGRYSCFWSSEAIVKALQPKISPNAVYLTKFDLKKLKLLFEKTLEEISRCGPNPYFFPWEHAAICSDQIKFPHGIPVPEEYQTELFCADMSLFITHQRNPETAWTTLKHAPQRWQKSVHTDSIYIYICRIQQSSSNIQQVLRLYIISIPSLHFRSQGDGGQDGLHLETPRRSETGVT